MIVKQHKYTLERQEKKNGYRERKKAESGRERECTYRAEVGVFPCLQSLDLRREQNRGRGKLFFNI